MKRRMTLALAAVALLLDGCGNGRYQFVTGADDQVVCRLDTKTGAVVCALLLPTDLPKPAKKPWEVIRAGD